MFNFVTGIVLVLLTATLYIWVLPPDDQPSRLLDRWGLRTLFPVFITFVGVAGFLLLAKSVLTHMGI